MVVWAEDTIVENHGVPTQQSIELERQQQLEALEDVRRNLIEDTIAVF